MKTDCEGNTPVNLGVFLENSERGQLPGRTGCPEKLHSKTGFLLPKAKLRVHGIKLQNLGITALFFPPLSRNVASVPTNHIVLRAKETTPNPFQQR